MKPIVYIISTYSNQNELLGNYLSSNNRVEACQKCIHEINNWIDLNHSTRKSLLLFDWLRNDSTLLWETFYTFNKNIHTKVYAAAFNFVKNRQLIRDILYSGLRGVFFESDSLDLIQKGVAAILKSELWFSREILEECLVESNCFLLKSIRFQGNSLTLREKEILKHIVSGQKNNEIAESLGVSVNTVKTHIYKLFQKIHVTNRLQASLWALKNTYHDLHPELPIETPHGSGVQQ